MSVNQYIILVWVYLSVTPLISLSASLSACQLFVCYFVCFSDYLSVCLSSSLLQSLSLCLSQSPCLLISQSVYVSFITLAVCICVFISLLIHLQVFLCFFQCVCSSLCQDHISLKLSMCLFCLFFQQSEFLCVANLSVYQSIYLSFNMSI